jgi:hypothetical protein
MTTQFEQFASMLDNLERFNHRVHCSKNINLAPDSHYDVVEMSSSAGCLMLGFSRETGKLVDVIGPLLLPQQGPRGPFL